MLNIIVAHDENLGIGRNNKLLCNLKDDLRLFNIITKKTFVVMGRKTFESIGKPLPDRANIILTKNNKNLTSHNVLATDDIQQLLLLSKSTDVNIIGGGEIYKIFLPYADTLYITKIHHAFDDVDTYFPKYDVIGWKIISQIYFPKNERNEYPFTFTCYVDLNK